MDANKRSTYSGNKKSPGNNYCPGAAEHHEQNQGVTNLAKIKALKPINARQCQETKIAAKQPVLWSQKTNWKQNLRETNLARLSP